MAKKARKWSNLQGEVEEAPVEITERELAVRQLVDERRLKSMKELAAEYQDVCEEDDFASLAEKDRSKKYEALERLIREQLVKVEELSGQDSWRGEGQLFSPQTKPIPVVVDRQLLMEHIRSTGQEALLTLEYPRLKSLVTDALETLLQMTPAERAESKATLASPIPGVKIFIQLGVHRTETRPSTVPALGPSRNEEESPEEQNHE